MIAKNWIGFNDDTLPIIFSKLHIREVNDSHLYDDDEDHIIHCECCHNELTKDEIGAIVHGSKKIYCDKTECIADYILKSI